MRCNPLFLFTIAIVKSEIQQKSNHKGDLIKAQNSIQSIKKLCGEVCETQVDYLPQSGKYFPNIWKNFDCPQLFKHDWNQMGAEFSTPPKWTSLSFDIQKQLTWDGMFHLAIHYMNDNFQIPAKKWTQNMVEEFQRNFQDGTLFGNYGVDNVNRISKIIDDKMQLKDKHVLVIGSETPWLESMLLTKGAKMVSTLEYKKLQSTHPLIQTLLPDEFDQLYWNGTRFDALVTYSSLEHSGLGRYGDRLNPWGDLITMAKSWCILKPKSLAFVGVPAYKDYLFYNMNRRYGLKTLPHLFANWKQIHTDLEVLKSHKRKIGEGLQDSIFVLQKTEKIEDMFDE